MKKLITSAIFVFSTVICFAQLESKQFIDSVSKINVTEYSKELQKNPNAFFGWGLKTFKGKKILTEADVDNLQNYMTFNYQKIQIREGG